MFDIGPRAMGSFQKRIDTKSLNAFLAQRNCFCVQEKTLKMNSRVGALLWKAVRDFGILIFHEPASWNVKQTNRVTVFDIGPGAGAPVLIIQINSENTREIVAMLQ